MNARFVALLFFIQAILAAPYVRFDSCRDILPRAKYST